MTTEGLRHVAYADIVGGLLDARLDPATRCFDAELASALAAGTVTAEAARTLRFWQRASVRGLVEHARYVLPPALVALDESWRESQATMEADKRSWQEVTGAMLATTSGESSTTSDDATTDATINLADRRHSRLMVAALMSSTVPDNSYD
jgi:hypothetical protein